MVLGEDAGLLAGVIALGAVHGIEPGHGWPVAATYALDRANKWLYGFVAGFVIGVGHLLSSLAMVAVFFYAKGYFDLTQVNEPIPLVGGVTIGGPVSLVAGVLLIVLGVREYRHGHSHGHSHDHDDHAHGDDHAHDDGHSHDDRHPASAEQSQETTRATNGGIDHSLSHPTALYSRDDHARENHSHHGHSHVEHGHSHTHDAHSHGSGGRLARLKRWIPFVGGHSHDHGDLGESVDRGLWGIAWFAFVLGFAHEEEFEIIAMCAGSTRCLELMSAYALTVVVAIVGLTMLLIAGYQHFEERVERYTPYLPVFSAAVLVGMGVGFIAGVF